MTDDRSPILVSPNMLRNMAKWDDERLKKVGIDPKQVRRLNKIVNKK